MDPGRDVARCIAPGTVGPQGRSSSAQQAQRDQDEQRPDHERRDAARGPSPGAGNRLPAGRPAAGPGPPSDGRGRSSRRTLSPADSAVDETSLSFTENHPFPRLVQPSVSGRRYLVMGRGLPRAGLRAHRGITLSRTLTLLAHALDLGLPDCRTFGLCSEGHRPWPPGFKARSVGEGGHGDADDAEVGSRLPSAT